MATETLVLGSKGVRRRRTLEPYLLKVQEVLRREPFDATKLRKLSIDGVAMSLEPWVVASVLSPDDARAGESDRAELLRQGLALWLKSALDVRGLHREMKSGSANLYEAQAKLMLDSSFGTTLLQDLQKSVDGLVQQGNLEEAKRLSKFRHQVTGLVREVKQLIAESNGPASPTEAAPAAPQETPPPAAANLPSIPDEPEHTHQAPRRRPRPQPTTDQAGAPGATPARFLTPVLVALDLVALVAWMVVAWPSQARNQTVEILNAHDFVNATPLVEVVARPPAVYASVDEKIWSGYDGKQKRHFVDEMGNVLLTHGYGGLLLKTSDGALVGEWLEKGGTRLLHVAPVVPSAPERVVTGEYSRFVP